MMVVVEEKVVEEKVVENQEQAAHQRMARQRAIMVVVVVAQMKTKSTIEMMQWLEAQKTTLIPTRC